MTEIVQKQQNEIEIQNNIFRLRGVWGSLLKTTNIPSLAEYDDECSTVMTWLSLKCAHDAKVSLNKHDHIEFDINHLLNMMQTLFNESEEKSYKLSYENRDLRRLLNENGAKYQKLLQESEYHHSLIQKLEMEVEDWRSKARFT